MRSEAQQLATDHARDRQQLGRIARELADAERERSDALAAQRRLERARPGWFRPAARREHADALAGAREERETELRSASLRCASARLSAAGRASPGQSGWSGCDLPRARSDGAGR